MGTDRQTDHATCIATGRILRYALRCVLKITANAKIGGISSENNVMNGTKLVVNASSLLLTDTVTQTAPLHARDVCSCTSLLVFVYRVRALSAATPI